MVENNDRLLSQLQFLREENRRLKEGLVVLGEELAAVRQGGEALSDREERHRRLTDDLPAMVCEFLPDSTLTYANKAYCDYHGLTLGELLGTPFLKFIPAEEHEAYRQTYMALTPEQPFNIHVQRVDHKGKLTWQEWRDRAFFNEQGEAIRFQSIGFDITERTLAEKALQESEEQYRGIFEYSPLGLFNFDVNGITTDCNNSFVEIIGSTHEKIIGLNVLELPDKRVAQCATTALGGQLASYEGDYHSVTADKVTPVRGRFFPVFSSTNEVMGGTGIIEDVTERRRADEVLRASEEKWKHYVESAPYGISVVNRAGEYLEVNAEICRITGYTAQELLSMTVADLAINGGPHTLQHFRKLVREGYVSGEALFRRRDGHERWWSIVAQKLSEDRFIGFSEDITERKRLAQDYQLLFTEMLDGFALHEIICDEEGQPVDYRFLAVNAAFEQMTGLDSDHVVGRTVLEVLPTTEPYWIETYGTVALTGEPLSFEQYSQALDKYFEVKAFSPEPRRFACIFNDITARRQVEQQLQEEKLRAETASSAKSQFLANMSHEIRTPMNGIMGFLQLLELTQIDSQQKAYVDYIKGSTDSLLAVLNNILDLSKIESGKMQLEDSIFELPATIEASVVPFAAKAHSQGLDLNVLVKSSVPQYVVGDPMRLQQALSNLVSNAIKFTRQGSVRVTAAQVSEAETTSIIQVQIKDTGIGMTEEIIAEVFKPFTQADASNTRQYGGTGLGLTIAHDLISLMGGDIKVVSTPGLGSTFTVTLAMAKRQDFLGELAATSHLLEGNCILVVTANDDVQEILRTYLEDAGCQVKEAYSTKEALQTLTDQRTPYDAVIIDEQAVYGNESEFIATLRSALSTRKTPICLLASVFEGVQKARAAGFEAYLTKPLRRQEVVDSLVSILRGQSLPRHGSYPTMAHYETSEFNDLRRLRVLVVEDQAVSRELAVQLLRKWGIQCHAVDNGQEAVDVCRRRQYDIVLMDCQMPVMDGYEATRQIRRFRRDCQPWIIAVTAHALKQDRERCLDAGMDDYLTKPLDFDKLLDIMKRAVSFSSRRFHSMVHDLMVETELDRSTVEELLQQGMLACKEIAGKVQRALQDSDVVTARRWLQRLRSNADSLCFKSLSEDAKAADALLSRDDVRNGVEIFATILRGIKQMEEDVQAK